MHICLQALFCAYPVKPRRTHPALYCSHPTASRVSRIPCGTGQTFLVCAATRLRPRVPRVVHRPAPRAASESIGQAPSPGSRRIISPPAHADQARALKRHQNRPEKKNARRRHGSGSRHSPVCSRRLSSVPAWYSIDRYYSCSQNGCATCRHFNSQQSTSCSTAHGHA